MQGFGPNVDWDTVDFSRSPAIQETPVTSVICQPSDGQEVRLVDGSLELKGYAYSGGGRQVIRVDVSVDGGASWCQAQTLETHGAAQKAFGWTLWTAMVPVESLLQGRSSKARPLELVCKAIDSGYNSQPENPSHIWNLRGVLSHAYHKVKVTVVGSSN